MSIFITFIIGLVKSIYFILQLSNYHHKVNWIYHQIELFNNAFFFLYHCLLLFMVSLLMPSANLCFGHAFFLGEKLGHLLLYRHDQQCFI